MSKRVLIISGSPRKNGNSDILCGQFEKGAREAGNTVEKVDLRELKIGYCKACYGCRGTGVCVQKDDMESLLEKMAAADVLVLATPVYFYSMDGQMKTMRDKDVYLIATAAAGRRAMARTMDALKGFTDCLPGAKVRREIYGEGVYQKGEVESTPAYREAYEAGKTV